MDKKVKAHLIELPTPNVKYPAGTNMILERIKENGGKVGEVTTGICWSADYFQPQQLIVTSDDKFEDGQLVFAPTGLAKGQDSIFNYNSKIIYATYYGNDARFYPIIAAYPAIKGIPQISPSFVASWVEGGCKEMVCEYEEVSQFDSSSNQLYKPATQDGFIKLKVVEEKTEQQINDENYERSLAKVKELQSKGIVHDNRQPNKNIKQVIPTIIPSLDEKAKAYTKSHNNYLLESKAYKAGYLQAVADMRNNWANDEDMKNCWEAAVSATKGAYWDSKNGYYTPTQGEWLADYKKEKTQNQ